MQERSLFPSQQSPQETRTISSVFIEDKTEVQKGKRFVQGHTANKRQAGAGPQTLWPHAQSPSPRATLTWDVAKVWVRASAHWRHIQSSCWSVFVFVFVFHVVLALSVQALPGVKNPGQDVSLAYSRVSNVGKSCVSLGLSFPILQTWSFLSLLLSFFNFMVFKFWFLESEHLLWAVGDAREQTDRIEQPVTCYEANAHWLAELMNVGEEGRSPRAGGERWAGLNEWWVFQVKEATSGVILATHPVWVGVPRMQLQEKNKGWVGLSWKDSCWGTGLKTRDRAGSGDLAPGVFASASFGVLHSERLSPRNRRDSEPRGVRQEQQAGDATSGRREASFRQINSI